MEPGRHTYKVKAGDCLKLRAILKDSDDAVINLAGYSSLFTLYGGTPDPYTRSSALATLTITDAQGLIEGEVPGNIVTTLGLQANYTWSVTEPSGCVVTFLQGPVLLV